MKKKDKTKYNKEKELLENKNFFKDYEDNCLKTMIYFKTNDKKVEVLHNQEEVHAELVILEKVWEAKQKNPSEQNCYNIAVTKFACELCHIVLEHFNQSLVKIFYQGSHRMIYAGDSWNFPSFVKDHDMLFEKLYFFLYDNLAKVVKKNKHDGRMVINEKFVVENLKIADPFLKKVEDFFNGDNFECNLLEPHKYPKLSTLYRY